MNPPSTEIRHFLARSLCALSLATAGSASLAKPISIPPCRLDDSAKELVRSTLTRATTAFKELGRPLPFDDIVVNNTHAVGNRTLVVVIVTDASADGVSPQGCLTRIDNGTEPLDPVSVRGGCVLVAANRMELRCSANAIRIFGDVGQKTHRANPALLYVLAHELGHLYQRRAGEYAGRAERIDLNQDQARKLKDMQESCDPNSTRKEEEADALALEVLALQLIHAPYREPLFSDRGSLYWNIDQLALASDTWQKASVERELMSQPAVHKSFVPTEFPTPAKTVDINARRFVCDVLTQSDGAIYHPLKSLTHPPAEQRLMRIAEALEPIAKQLPDNSAQRQYAPISRLQTDLSPVFAQIYRETGIYMKAVQARICTEVNAPIPPRCK